MRTHQNPLATDIAGAILHNRLRQSPVASAINAHLNAVTADEAQFDDDGMAPDPAAAVETLRAEIETFRKFCETPCETPDDVQAKIRYLLYGTVGERQTLVECLMDGESGWSDVKDFLKSLLVQDFPHALTHARVARGARAHEDQTAAG